VTLVAAIEGAVLAACFLRYADALKLGDSVASPRVRAAWQVVSRHILPADMERLWRRWGIENPTGLDPARIERDRRMLDGDAE
jgi:hypothetical protein